VLLTEWPASMEAVDALAGGDPVFDIMQNRHVLKAYLGGLWFHQDVQ